MSSTLITDREAVKILVYFQLEVQLQLAEHCQQLGILPLSVEAGRRTPQLSPPKCLHQKHRRQRWDALLVQLLQGDLFLGKQPTLDPIFDDPSHYPRARYIVYLPTSFRASDVADDSTVIHFFPIAVMKTSATWTSTITLSR